MAKYSSDYLGAKRYVLFYKSSKSGFKSMQAFANQVEKNNGEVVGVVRINRNQVDFQAGFQAITGGFKEISEEEKDVR